MLDAVARDETPSHGDEAPTRNAVSAAAGEAETDTTRAEPRRRWWQRLRAGSGPAPVMDGSTAIHIAGLSKSYAEVPAVESIDLEIPRGRMFGLVGPNGAGKTTVLSMMTGLVRPDSGGVSVNGIDVWSRPDEAKAMIGILPDGLRIFDRLTGAQFLYYAAVLRGIDGATTRTRSRELAAAFGIDDALPRLVSDYSVGMTKMIGLAAAMIHSPRILVLDEPFESVDPVTAAGVIDVLRGYVAHGGTVVLSSHDMEFVERVCSDVAVIARGLVLATGTMDEVRAGGTLAERFAELSQDDNDAGGMEWLHTFSS